MTPTLHVSIALKTDAGGIAGMSRDLIEHGLPWTWGAERVSHAIASPNLNVASRSSAPSESWSTGTKMLTWCCLPFAQPTSDKALEPQSFGGWKLLQSWLVQSEFGSRHVETT
jgi:hypothetical protein